MNKPNLPNTLIAFLIQTITPQWFLFLFIAILPLALAADHIVFPYCIKLIIDIITNFNGERSDIYIYIGPTLCLGLGTWIFLVFVWRFLDAVDALFIPNFQANIRLKMFECVENHSHRYFSEEFSGSVANKISDLVDASWQIIFFIFKSFLPATFSFFISIIIMGNIHLGFSIITLLFYISHMCICIYSANNCDILSNNHAESRSVVQGNIVDSLTNIINVRLFARNKFELDHIKKYQNTEISAYKKLLWSFFNTRLILDIFALLMIVAITYFLIRGWQQKTVSPGDFSFIITVTFNNMLSIWRMGGELPNFFKDIGVCKQALRMTTDNHLISDIPCAPDLIVTRGEISFSNVYFHYTDGQELFVNKNIKINAGEKVGLVGFSGSGKSTFVNLILRYFNLEKGKILIDNQNIALVTQDSLRQAIAMVPQDVTLFHRSLMDNIRFGNLNATEEEVIQASKKAHCHEFIIQFDQGYNLLVGERGVKLSGGQRQRIAIARAILKNAPILILDEATSALDSMTEKYIQDSLSSLILGKTTIIIAHRLSTLLGVDRILVFHSGKIIEEGKHIDLLNQKGHYAKLWDMQVGGFLPIHP